MGRHTAPQDAQARVRRPAEPDEKAAWALRLIGNHDVATGTTTGLLAQCATDPTWLTLMREIRDHTRDAYLMATALAARAAQEGGQLSLGDIARLEGIARQSVHEAARKGQALLDARRERLGVAVLRQRRQQRLEAAGLAEVVDLEQRRQATG